MMSSFSLVLCLVWIVAKILDSVFFEPARNDNQYKAFRRQKEASYDAQRAFRENKCKEYVEEFGGSYSPSTLKITKSNGTVDDFMSDERWSMD